MDNNILGVLLKFNIMKKHNQLVRLKSDEKETKVKIGRYRTECVNLIQEMEKKYNNIIKAKEEEIKILKEENKNLNTELLYINNQVDCIPNGLFNFFVRIRRNRKCKKLTE